MIFDGHAYCFPPTGGDGGFSDPDDFRRHLQQAMATHHQPVWRSRDLAAGDTDALIDSTNWPSLDALKPSDFHAASNGRFEWTVDGERYFKQYFPPSVTDMSYTPDRLVAEMDYAGVSRALLHRTPYLGIGNDFTADCVAQYPDRLLGLAHTPEWLTHTEPDASLARVRRAVREQGLVGLQFLPPQLDLYNYDGPWDAPEFHRFWDGVAELGVPVFFSLKPRRSPESESYAAELETIVRWTNRYPGRSGRDDARSGVADVYERKDSLELTDEVFVPFDHPNLYLQFLFPIALGAVWDYPMAEAQPAIEKCVSRIGADRLMWGTDMPIVMRFWTYRQNIDHIRKYSDFLSERDRDMILGGTVASLLGVD